MRCPGGSCERCGSAGSFRARSTSRGAFGGERTEAALRWLAIMFVPKPHGNPVVLTPRLRTPKLQIPANGSGAPASAKADAGAAGSARGGDGTAVPKVASAPADRGIQVKSRDFADVYGAASARPRKTYDEHLVEYWHEFSSQTHPNVFEHGGVCIATDGGVSDLHALMYPMQYFYAFMVVAFAGANVYMITHANLLNIFKEQAGAEERQFLLSKCIARKVLKNFPELVTCLEGSLDRSLFFAELLFLYILLVRMIWLAAASLLAQRLYKPDRADIMRWRHCSTLLAKTIPWLSSFSAMRLLYWVTPSVIGTQAYNICYLANQVVKFGDSWRHHVIAAFMVIRYILFLLFVLVVGFDAFLIKFRQATLYVDNREITFAKVLGALIFLFQIMGVVNLNWFVRDRLCQFVFGGEDGNVDLDELARIEVWNAVLAKRIFNHFGFFQAVVVLLGFDDYDFQMLVLDDKLKSQGDDSAGKLPSLTFGGMASLVSPAGASVLRQRQRVEDELSRLSALRRRIDLIEQWCDQRESLSRCFEGGGGVDHVRGFCSAR